MRPHKRIVIEMDAALMTSAGSADRRHVKMSVPGLVLAVLGVVACTVAVTTLMTGPAAAAPATAKFAMAPSNRGHRAARRSVSMSFGEEAGVLPPTGYLDPLGFGKKASPERLRWFREAELKHGRIAMLAVVGFLVGENPQLKTALFPDNPEFAGSGGLASHTLTDHNLDQFWYSLFVGIGFMEQRFFDKFDSVLDWKLKPNYPVGDLGFDPLNYQNKAGWAKTPAEFQRRRTVELQNGRLAMLAIAGFNAQEMTDSKPIWPIHGLGDAASAEELQAHAAKGLELVREMGQVLADTSAAH